MKFAVDTAVFERFPNYCVGVVVARNITNRKSPYDLVDRYNEVQRAVHTQLPTVSRVRTDPCVSVWRDAFSELGYNPNRYPPSIEALIGRVARGGMLPSINLAVDLVNMTSLRHRVPMGAHDLGRIEGRLRVRLAEGGERFVPLGSDQDESVPAGELVYGDNAEVRTRRWIWRQGDNAKVVLDTDWLFVPIDGFVGTTDYRVKRAQEEVVLLLHDFFEVDPLELWVDGNRPEVAVD